MTLGSIVVGKSKIAPFFKAAAKEMYRSVSTDKLDTKRDKKPVFGQISATKLAYLHFIGRDTDLIDLLSTGSHATITPKRQ